jgi:hypothetical protein
VLRSARHDVPFALFAAALTLATAAAFYAPALAATHGDWPAPLDDVFIHYDFARSTAGLHPFEWIAGQGYSSGETSPLYALSLAAGYLIGFRGLSLGVWAAALACGSLVVMMRSVRELVSPSPAWVSWLGAAMLVSMGVLDWTWFSGMEGAVFSATLAVTLVHAKRAREAPPARRRREQNTVGLLGAALVLLRPEAAILVALVAVAVARRALSQSARGALARSAGPAVIAGVAILGANLHFTGDGPSAGAIAKLLSYHPFLSDIDRAKAFAVSLTHIALLLGSQLGRGTGLALLVPSLCIPALVSRRTRALGFVCVLGALGWTLLVSWNDAARFQNFRYYMPALALLLFAAALGLAALARARNVAFGLGGGAVAVAGSVLAASGLPEQIDFFANASKNIHDQQVEVGRRLAVRMPMSARVLVGDAGAIAYVSGRGAVDALGLGGYHGLPFARAALEGQAATVELIERLAPDERPRFMALYPSWFGDITRNFGREVDHVSLERNFVCGGLTKTIYEADWSALADDPEDDPPPGGGVLADMVDVADVVSERDHAYVSPAPLGGWTSLDVRADGRGVRRFDAGRTIPEGRSERFTLRRGARYPAAIIVRTDEADADVEARLSRGGAIVDVAPFVRGPAAAGSWTTTRAAFERELQEGDEIVLQVVRGTFKDFHVWVVTGASRTPL